MNQLQVPSKIKALIENKPFTIDDIGMSGNQVLIFEDMVLKIEDSSAAMEQQVQMMQWLDGKVPVPQVIAYEVENRKSYLLMSKIGGDMSCDTYYLEHPEELLEALTSGLKMFWERGKKTLSKSFIAFCIRHIGCRNRTYHVCNYEIATQIAHNIM